MIEEYIRSSQMSTLAQELREELDSPITLTEIQSAIGKMKPGQSPRPRRLHNTILQNLFADSGVSYGYTV